MPTAAFVFPGQGSQARGMGTDVAARFPSSRECFDRASEVLGYDLLARVGNASEEELRETRLSQPAILTANLAIYRAVCSLGLDPIATAGHSFGEYCSLEIARAMDFKDAVRVVNERGLAMGEAADRAPGAMAAIIGIEEAAVEAVCRQARKQSGARVDLGNLNTLTQIVVSGDVAGVQAACEIAKEAGAKRVRLLNVSGAWHSSLMQPATPRFARAVAQAPLRMPAFNVISNVFARPYKTVEEIKEALVASLCSRVRWHEAAVALAGCHPDVIIECGASEVLAPMVKRLPNIGAARVAHVAEVMGLERLRAALGLSAA